MGRQVFWFRALGVLAFAITLLSLFMVLFLINHNSGRSHRNQDAILQKQDVIIHRQDKIIHRQDRIIRLQKDIINELK